VALRGDDAGGQRLKLGHHRLRIDTTEQGIRFRTFHCA
jgi:hypothetical protein